MRAVWYDRQGPANEVIVTGELPTPAPGTGQVLVRLEASGVNPSDTYRRRGAVPAEYPRVIPNSDGAGVVLFGPDGNLRPLEDIEADVIRLAIGHYRGRMTEVARRLGIGRSTLYRKLSELGIDNAA